jgi:hypothetical protein
MNNNEYSKPTIDEYKTYLSRFLRWTEKSALASISKNINLFLESEKQNHPKLCMNVEQAYIFTTG